MVYNPRTDNTIYETLRDRLINKISGLTNFSENSFNFVWTNAYSARFRDAELALLAVQLSGWIDYAGGPITEDDLEKLGIENVEPDEINQFMEDQDLDNLAQLVGTDRSEGQNADGSVDITTVSAPTTVPDETVFSTQPDANGDILKFTTDEEVSTGSGETSVSVNITATEVGDEYNVGAGAITYIPSPPGGVEAVTNPSATTGGQDRESNEELRAKTKEAIFNKSGGGTILGIEGFIAENVEDVTSVSVKEYPGGNDSTGPDYEGPGGPGGASSTSPFADVIVEGGTSSSINDAIDESRPVAIQHNLVRPTTIGIGIEATVEGGNIDTAEIEDLVASYINGLGLADDLYRDKVIQQILNADSDVDNITSLTISVLNESIEFSAGTDVYALRKGGSMDNDGITEVTGTLSGSSTTFVEDTDYQEWNTTAGDTSTPHDAIDWSLAGDDPDDTTDFFVDYTITEDIPIDEYEKASQTSITINTA
jgi:uncharacterized phage protein gp47/JayE